MIAADRLPAHVLERLRLPFSESSLPMRVDIVEWAILNETFRAIVASTSVTIQSPD